MWSPRAVKRRERRRHRCGASPQGTNRRATTTHRTSKRPREAQHAGGYANDDLVRNILRTVCEERLVLTVTRPAAVLAITDLPES